MLGNKVYRSKRRASFCALKITSFFCVGDIQNCSSIANFQLNFPVELHIINFWIEVSLKLELGGQQITLVYKYDLFAILKLLFAIEKFYISWILDLIISFIFIQSSSCKEDQYGINMVPLSSPLNIHTPWLFSSSSTSSAVRSPSRSCTIIGFSSSLSGRSSSPSSSKFGISLWKKLSNNVESG